MHSFSLTCGLTMPAMLLDSSAALVWCGVCAEDVRLNNRRLRAFRIQLLKTKEQLLD